MKKISLLGLTAFVLLSCNNVFAQTLPVVQRAAVRLTKITQVGHSISGTTKGFLIKGTFLDGGTTINVHTIKGTYTTGIVQECMDLTSKQNINALGASSNILINFTFTSASSGGVVGGPINHDYVGAVITSCYLTNN